MRKMKDMKAVVLEINKGKAIVLDNSGRFHKIPDNGSYTVGCETVIPESIMRRSFKPAKAVSIAAAFIIAFSSLGAYTYSLPYSYMEVDINPSVQFTANIYNRIIKAESCNEEGKAVIAGDSYKNMSLKNGLSRLLEKAQEKGYITDGAENAVLVTVASRSKNRADDIIKGADNSVKNAAGPAEKIEDAETDPDPANTEVKTEVIAEGVPLKLRQKQIEKKAASPGRTALIEKLISENPQLNAEELENASVKELVESIKEIRKQKKEEDKKLQEEAREKAKQEKSERKQQGKETAKKNNRPKK